VRFIDSGGTRRPNCITRVGEIFRVGQRAARPVPERWPAVPKRDCVLREPVQGRRRAQNPRIGKGPGIGQETRAPHVLGAKGGIPKQDALRSRSIARSEGNGIGKCRTKAGAVSTGPIFSWPTCRWVSARSWPFTWPTWGGQSRTSALRSRSGGWPASSPKSRGAHSPTPCAGSADLRRPGSWRSGRRR